MKVDDEFWADSSVKSVKERENKVRETKSYRTLNGIFGISRANEVFCIRYLIGLCSLLVRVRLSLRKYYSLGLGILCLYHQLNFCAICCPAVLLMNWMLSNHGTPMTSWLLPSCPVDWLAVAQLFCQLTGCFPVVPSPS